MKSQFEFPLKLGEAEFAEPATFKFATTGTVAIKREGKIVPEHVSAYEVEFQLAADPENDSPNVKGGKLLITLRGQPEVYYPLAQRLAGHLSDHLAFFYPGFSVEGGYLAAERIPESEDEAAELGDRRHWVLVSFQEFDGGPRPFDREHLRLFPASMSLLRVIRQYNAAQEAKSEPDAFLGMFKVVETLFHSGRGGARETLKKSEILRELLRDCFRVKRQGAEEWSEPNDQDISEMIDALVETRANCAHLREQNAFGYAPGDPQIFERVKPRLEILKRAARKAILGKLEQRRANSPENGGG